MSEFRSVLQYNVSKPILPEHEIAISDQNVYVFLRATHFDYARIEFEDARKLYAVFDVIEVGEDLRKYNAGEALPVDFRDVIAAYADWKEKLTMMRNLRDATHGKKNAVPAAEVPQKVEVSTPVGA